MGSDPLNGQELATHGTITYQAHVWETILRNYIFLQETEEQVDIEKVPKIVDFLKKFPELLIFWKNGNLKILKFIKIKIIFGNIFNGKF